MNNMLYIIGVVGMVLGIYGYFKTGRRRTASRSEAIAMRMDGPCSLR